MRCIDHLQFFGAIRTCSILAEDQPTFLAVWFYLGPAHEYHFQIDPSRALDSTMKDGRGKARNSRPVLLEAREIAKGIGAQALGRTQNKRIDRGFSG